MRSPLLTPVTYSRKRYVFVCLACDRLSEASRADQVTCSPRCRVHLHRHPELVADLRVLAAKMHITVAQGQHAAALLRLCPELEAPIMAGTLTMEAARPQVLAAFDRLVMQVARQLAEKSTFQNRAIAEASYA